MWSEHLREMAQKRAVRGGDASFQRQHLPDGSAGQAFNRDPVANR
jgi:hypothetical protein